MNTFSLTVLSALAVASFSGCVQLKPHTSQRSPEIRGRVIDSVTHSPVQYATVALHGHPIISARTDRAGFYHIEETRNVHLVTFLGICSWDFPQGEHYHVEEVDVSHPRYQAARIKAREYLDPRTTNEWLSLVLRDISLTPISKP